MAIDKKPVAPESEDELEGEEAEASAPSVKAAPSAPVFDPDVFARQITYAVAQQLDGLRGEMRSMSKAEKKEKEQEAPDWETQFYENPKATMDKFAKALREEITTELVGRYDAERANRDYWGGFYSDNPYLREHDTLVRAMLNSQAQRWANEGITVEESYKRLADAASAIGGKLAPAKKEEQEGGMVIDGLAFVQTPQRETKSGEKVLTLSDAVRARQAKFRKA